MTRHPSSDQIRIALAGMARQAPDDVEGYVVVLAKGADVLATMTNSAGLATTIGILARAIEHAAADVAKLEDAT